MKNQNRVRREGDSKGASAQARSQSTKQAASGLKTYRVFTARAGETDMTQWQEGERIQARSPLDAARRHLRQFKRVAVCRFNQGNTDYIFDLVKENAAAPEPPTPAGLLMLADLNQREKGGRAPLTAAELAAIQQAAQQRGLPLQVFLKSALLDAANATPSPARGDGLTWDELTLLDTATREVKALHHCVIGLLDEGGRLNDELIVGLQTLGWRTQRELESLTEQGFARLKPRRAAEGRAA